MLVALDHKDAETILGPVRNVSDNENLFQRSGLAIFLSADPASFRYYTVDIPLEEKLMIADRFYVKPLLPLLMNSEPFYVLTLSQNQVHLLEGTRHHLQRVVVPNLPKSMNDALQLESPGRNPGERPAKSPGHANAPGRTTTGIGSAAATFAGRGAGEADPKEDIEQYCHRINAAVHDILKDKTAPLILAAIDYLRPLYRTTNTYPHLLDEGISGNPEQYDARMLLERANAILDPTHKQKQADATNRYKELIHKKQASNRPVDVLIAAHMGQVDTLFIPGDSALWGTYNFDNNQMQVHAEQRAGDSDLFDLAATQTLLNNGTVYVIPSSEMPDNSPVAAFYRYAL